MRVQLFLVGILGAVVGVLALATGLMTGFLEVNRSVLIASAAPPLEADQVQALAERLLSPAVPGPDGRAQSTRLLVGQWPTGSALDLPIPPDGRLVGSSIRTADGSVMAVDGVLDVSGAVQDILAFYERELGAWGWGPAPAQPGPLGPGRGGFQPALDSSRGRSFCKSATGPWISVTVGPRNGTPNDVRVHVDSSQAGPCGLQSSQQPGGAGTDLLPPLVAPTGVVVQMQGSSNGPNRVTSDASAQTDQSPADLQAHFARQLQVAGWQRLAGGVDGPLAWSSWKVPRDGDWQGLLFVLDGPGQHHRALYARVESAAQPASGWTGSLSIITASSGSR